MSQIAVKRYFGYISLFQYFIYSIFYIFNVTLLWCSSRDSKIVHSIIFYKILKSENIFLEIIVIEKCYIFFNISEIEY